MWTRYSREGRSEHNRKRSTDFTKSLSAAVITAFLLSTRAQGEGSLFYSRELLKLLRVWPEPAAHAAGCRARCHTATQVSGSSSEPPRGDDDDAYALLRTLATLAPIAPLHGSARTRPRPRTLRARLATLPAAGTGVEPLSG